MENTIATSRYNRAVILNCLRHCAPVSRTRIHELTGIRTASITELVKELVEEQVVVETGVAEPGGQRGRNRRQLELNDSFGCAVGIEFDADHIIGAVLDIKAEVICQRRDDEPFVGQGEKGIDQLSRFIEGLIRQAGIDRSKVLGIGVADPGLIDSKRGVSLLSTTIADWQNVATRDMLAERWKVPIFLEENTRTKLLAEKAYGAGRQAGYVMFIDFGPGIGCSVISPGGAYRGFTETAGEMGHTCVATDGVRCRCGSVGCLETVASLAGIARRGQEALREGVDSQILALAGGDVDKVDAAMVFAAAREGDKLALGLLDETGHYLGIALANAVNLFNPEIVIFNESLNAAGDLLLEPIKRTVLRQGLQVATRDLTFAVSALGAWGGALGAATLVLNDLFALPQLPRPMFLEKKFINGSFPLGHSVS